MANLLVPTVTPYGNMGGMNPRKIYEWNAVTFSTHTETADEASQEFDKDLLATFTPYSYTARIDLTDERIASDWDGIRASVVVTTEKRED